MKFGLLADQDDTYCRISKNIIMAVATFPTVHADVAVASGKWMYEVTLLTGGVMQVSRIQTLI